MYENRSTIAQQGTVGMEHQEQITDDSLHISTSRILFQSCDENNTTLSSVLCSEGSILTTKPGQFGQGAVQSEIWCHTLI